MSLKEEKSEVIELFKQLDDPQIIHAIKNLVDFGLKKQAESDLYNIPNSHKKLVRQRRKETKPEEYVEWGKAVTKLKA